MEISETPFARKARGYSFLGVICLHLVIVALGAAGFEFSSDTFLGTAINYYGEISGASFGFGFFAPGVTSQVRAVFDVVDDGTTRTFQLENGESREVDLRIGDIIEQFGQNETDDPAKFQRTLAASLSGFVFARHPEAKSVGIRLERFTPVSMDEFRKGARPDWVPLYSAQFVKNQR